MVQCNANPSLIADSTAVRLTTGSTPGIPRSTSVTFVFGSSPKALGACENILVAVLSSTWISNPSTGSNCATASAKGSMVVAVMNELLVRAEPRGRGRKTVGQDQPRPATQRPRPPGRSWHRISPGLECANRPAGHVQRCHPESRSPESPPDWPE